MSPATKSPATTPSTRRTPLTVHRATTEVERQAIYRFRYRVYYEEFGRRLGGPDHRRRWVRDADDELSTSTLLYTGTPERVTGTVRLRHWQAGEVPAHDVHELSIDRFGGYETLNTAEIGRLMVRPSLRGKLILAALLRAAYEILVGCHGTDLTFCYCSPGLVRYYQHLAMRPFGGRPVAAPDGVMLPLVAVMSDAKYYQRTGSFLAPLAVAASRNPARRSFDKRRYGHLFEASECGLQWQGADVAAEVEGRRSADASGSTVSPWVARATADSRLLDQGLVFDVPQGLMVTRRGFCEQDVYVVLEGVFEIERQGPAVRRVGPWQVFGDELLCKTFAETSGRRQATVRAVTDGRVLVLPAKGVRRWRRHRDEAARDRGAPEEFSAPPPTLSVEQAMRA